MAKPNCFIALIDLSSTISLFIVLGNERMENSHKFQPRDGNSITDWSETILIEKITMKTIAAGNTNQQSDDDGDQDEASSQKIRI